MYGAANLAPRRVVAHGLHLPRPLPAVARSEPCSAPAKVVPLSEYPKPEIEARKATEDEIPRAVRTFLKKLDDAEIPYDVRYARGWLPDNAGAPSKLIESVAVRMGTCVAIWHDGRFAVGLARFPAFGLRKVNLDQIKAFLGFEVKARARKAPDPESPPKLRLVKGREGMR